MAKRTLFLLNQPPYGSSHAAEAIEAILVARVFDQQVSVLFTGAGLYQLLSEQDGSAVGGRTVGKMLGAVPEYGVKRIHGHAHCSCQSLCQSRSKRTRLPVWKALLPTCRNLLDRYLNVMAESNDWGGPNRQWVIAKHPVTTLEASHFEYREAPVAEPGPGELLLKAHLFNIAPVMRMYMMEGGAAGEAPLEIGDLIHGRGVAEVIASNHAGFAPGEFVQG